LEKWLWHYVHEIEAL
jgi:hypothetical protein